MPDVNVIIDAAPVSIQVEAAPISVIVSGTRVQATDFASPSPIGNVAPNTGAFTTLSATGTATLPHIHGSIAGNLYVHVRNDSGGALSRGTPIYITGNVGDTDRVRVAAADHTNSAKMPAIGLLEQSLNHNGDGNAIIVGELPSANTNAYTLHQELYVGVGALTGTKPTTGEIQSVGVVSRVQTNTGVIVVNMQGRRTPDAAFATAAQGTDERVPTAAGLTSKFSTNKATIANGDKFTILDSAASDVPKHTLWSLIVSTLTTAFNALYVGLTGNQTIAGTKTFSGQVVMSTMPKVSAYKSTDQTGLTAGAYNKITFDTEVYDVGSNFASSTFTAPYACKVLINATIFTSGVSDSVALAVYKNGTQHKRIAAQDITTAANTIVDGSVVIDCATSDTIEIYLYTLNGRSVLGAATITHVQFTALP